MFSGPTSGSHYFRLKQNSGRFTARFQWQLCKACRLSPCVVDAAILANYDDGWTDENVVWWLDLSS